VVIEGVNIVKKHIKQGRARQAGIVEVEAALHVSNVRLICPNCGQPTRVGVRAGADGKNERYCKKCDVTVPRPDA
jgi:large subunit ribosomal protein L24